MFTNIKTSDRTSGVAFHQKSILILEDDVDDQDIMTDLIQLTSPVYTVSSIENTDKGWEYLTSLNQEQLPSLIILDLNMPTLGGLEFLKTLKVDSRFASIPVAVYSNSTYPPHATEVLEAGACIYLNKKGKYDAIKEDVKKMLEHCK